jgi:hypothetical protein
MAQRFSKNDTARPAISPRDKLIGAGAVIVLIIALVFLVRYIQSQSVHTQISINAPKYSSPKGQWILEQKQKAGGRQAGQEAPATPPINPMAPNAR